jgi:hypothetical protein
VKTGVRCKGQRAIAHVFLFSKAELVDARAVLAFGRDIAGAVVQGKEKQRRLPKLSRSGGDDWCLGRPSVSHEADPAEPQDYHGPGGEFGDCGDVAADLAPSELNCMKVDVRVTVQKVPRLSWQ